MWHSLGTRRKYGVYGFKWTKWIEGPQRRLDAFGIWLKEDHRVFDALLFSMLKAKLCRESPPAGGWVFVNGFNRPPPPRCARLTAGGAEAAVRSSTAAAKAPGPPFAGPSGCGAGRCGLTPLL